MAKRRSGVPERRWKRSFVALAGLVAIAVWTPMVAHGGQAPVIDDFSATTLVVVPGGTVNLSLSAHDPDYDANCSGTACCGTYIRADWTVWTADGGSFTVIDNGVNGSPYTATADWQAPTVEMSYTVSVEISENGGSLCFGTPLTASDQVTILVTSTPNQPPVVSSLTADPTSVGSGDMSALSCTASDPDSDPLTYSWSSDLGTVTPTVDGAAEFVSQTPGQATITCKVSDPWAGVAQETVAISVFDLWPERRLRSAFLAAPSRLSVDSLGQVYVVDQLGLEVVHLVTGAFIYRLPLEKVTSVAVDWNDRLLVGMAGGLAVVERNGDTFMALEAAVSGGDIADVAVDMVRHRYAALIRGAGRVVVYDETGAVLSSFGSTGDGPEQLKSPQGLAITPTGELVVADSGHGLIKVFDLAGTLQNSFGGLGGGVGEFVQLDDVAVDSDGTIYASDVYQDWVLAFNGDGSFRDTIGTYGSEIGEVKTPAGLLPVDSYGRFVIASLNGPSLQVFRRLALPSSQVPVPKALLSESSVAFGEQVVGVSGASREVLLQNSGDAFLGIHRVRVTGPFRQSNDCRAYLDPGASCRLWVNFVPTSAGVATGSLRIETSLRSTQLSVALSGTGQTPAFLDLSDPFLDFGDPPARTVSSPMSLVLRNGGTLPLSLYGFSVSGPFTLQNGCGETLVSGESCSVDLQFSAGEIGEFSSGALVIVSSVTESPHTVGLQGRGGGLKIASSPDLIDFGDLAVGNGSVPSNLLLLNRGTEPLQIGALSLSGDGAGEFAIQQETCSGSELLSTKACSVEIVFQPNQEGVRTAFLEAPSNVGDSPLVVTLQGTALPGAVEVIGQAPWSLFFLILLLGALGLVAAQRRSCR